MANFYPAIDTAANWASVNRTPLLNEWCLESDTLKAKVGDGSTPYNSLPYFFLPGATGPTGAGWNVTSTTGVPSNSVGSNGDYALDQGGNVYGPKASGTWPSTPIASLIPTTLPLSTISGTSYTLALTDAGKLLATTSSSAVGLVIPTHATVALPVSVNIVALQYGAGQFTISGQSGVTLHTSSSYTSRARYSQVSLYQYAQDEWIVGGDVT